MPRWNSSLKLFTSIFFEHIRLSWKDVYLTRAMAPDKSYFFASKPDNSALPPSVTYLSVILKQLILPLLVTDRKFSSLQENHRSLVFPPCLWFQSESWVKVKGFSKSDKHQQVNLHFIVFGKLLWWKGIAKSLQLLSFWAGRNRT